MNKIPKFLTNYLENINQFVKSKRYTPYFVPTIAGIIIVIVLISAGILFFSRNKLENEQKAITSTKPATTPTPLPSTPSPTVIKVIPTQSVSSTPTITLITNTPQPTQTPNTTPAYDPNEKVPPTIHRFVGLEEGGTYSYSSTCIPIQISDNNTPFPALVSRFKLDEDPWTNWGEAEFCTKPLSEGPHILRAEVKDTPGNVGSASISFTIISYNP